MSITGPATTTYDNNSGAVIDPLAPGLWSIVGGGGLLIGHVARTGAASHQILPLGGPAREGERWARFDEAMDAVIGYAETYGVFWADETAEIEEARIRYMAAYRREIAATA